MSLLKQGISDDFSGLFLDKYQCPRCGGYSWTRILKDHTNTGIYVTEMRCSQCKEKLHIRTCKGWPGVHILAKRWSLCCPPIGRSRYLAWIDGEPRYPAVYCGSTQRHDSQH